MKEFDVVVVGAGPAGSAAAKAASENGCRTLLIEEHTQIGIPQHCSGLLFGTKSGIGEKILALMDKRVILSKVNSRNIYSPRGKIFKIDLRNKGVWLVDRSLFDMEMASLSAETGVEIRLNTKVIGLLTDGDYVVGVKTSSKAIPEIRAKVVIAASGSKSLLGGLPIKSGLVEKSKVALSGMTWWLANVKDVEPGVQELHVGKYGGPKGWIWLERCNEHICITDFDNYDSFNECKKGDTILSKKMKDAFPLRVTGWVVPFPVIPLKKKVISGLITAGAAAKYYPFITCIASGQIAGETAAEAVESQDVSSEFLSVYDRRCEGLLGPESEIGFSSFSGLTEDEQEKVFDRMVSLKEVNFDVLPI